MWQISVFGGQYQKLHFRTNKAYVRGLAGGAFRGRLSVQIDLETYFHSQKSLILFTIVKLVATCLVFISEAYQLFVDAIFIFYISFHPVGLKDQSHYIHNRCNSMMFDSSCLGLELIASLVVYFRYFDQKFISYLSRYKESPYAEKCYLQALKVLKLIEEAEFIFWKCNFNNLDLKIPKKNYSILAFGHEKH